MGQRPAAIIFDLDGCLWEPEMYELWGGGAPFSDNGDGTLADKSGVTVRLLGAVREVLSALHCSDEWSGTVVGIASRTDEPAWAQACLEQFTLPDGRGGTLPMKRVFSVEEIHKGNKAGPLRSIAQATGIELERMLFFDNERGNCRDVAPLGVTCCYCPEGVTAEIWRLALENFPVPRGKMVGPQGVCAP